MARRVCSTGTPGTCRAGGCGSTTSRSSRSPWSRATRSPRFLGRVRPREGQADSTLFVIRERFVGDGMQEDLVLRNLGVETTACSISVDVEADFAHLFDVKEGRARSRGETDVIVTETALVFTYAYRESTRRITVVPPPGSRVASGVITTQAVVPPRSEWRACFEISLELDGERVEPRYRCGEPVDRSTPAARLRAWEQATPKVETDDEDINRTFGRSVPDLGVLRIFDPDEPGVAVLAAGAPWFMTLFGRDSLITSWMTVGVDPTIAVGTLLTLARYQGERVDPRTEEEPGRILHEMRSGMTGAAARGAESIYYGSIDATPLFVMLLGELHSWGVDGEIVDRLLPHADRALDWIGNYGDRDGDGFVEYQRSTDRGLVHQGWKDSFDGINFANGRLAEPPIALCEVQGYVYAAYLARARIARIPGRHRDGDVVRGTGAAVTAGLQRTFLARRQGPSRDRSRRREAPDRRADVEHRSLPVDRRRRRVPCRGDGRAPPFGGDVHWLGGSHAGELDGCLQPGELPQRLGVAPRQRHRRGGADALRLRPRGADHR